ncbi:glycosyltransferase family 32 protein [Pedobacter sp. WC2423]|uniref:glycosyltransferase family 32 protein n=1 Tax=Pedobacter sp. WC2423 TaxID=3234142 RepID=UPI0034671A97
MAGIPKKIHLIYKSHNIPEAYQEYFESIKVLHSDWDIKIYDDMEARGIIADYMPELLEIYDQYTLNVQRTDLFRIVVVYLFGGFYLDLDMLCFKPLDPLCNHDLVLGEEKMLTEEECTKFGTEHALRIANYMFGSIPKHSFWLEVIKELFKNAKLLIKNEDDVLNSTGPGLLTNVYHRKKSMYQTLTIIYNDGLRCMKFCETNSCHFGGYAAHFHLGQWRWETVN